MNRSFLWILLPLLLASCTENKPLITNADTIINISVAIATNNLQIGNYVDSTCFVVLTNTPQKALQAEITKAELYKDKIFTFDELHTKRVNAYNLNGEYLFSVGSIGRARNELLHISNFSFFGDEIYLTSALEKKTLAFSIHNGKYIKTIIYPFMAVGFNKLSTNRFLFELSDYNTNLGGDYLTNSVVVTDSLYHVISFGAPHPRADEVNYFPRSHWNTSFGNMYYSMYSESIYSYNLMSDTFTHTYAFDYGSDNPPVSVCENIDDYIDFYDSDVTRPASDSPIVLGDYVVASIERGRRKYFVVRKEMQTSAIEIKQNTYKFTDPFFILGVGVDSSAPVLISKVYYDLDNVDKLKQQCADLKDDESTVLLLSYLR